MAGEDFLVDEQGGEYRVVEGQEMRAVWVPLSAAEKAALVKKASAEGQAVGLLVAGFLKSYLKGSAELSLEDLEQVAGGAAMRLQQSAALYPSLVRDGFIAISQMPDRLDPGRIALRTVMCPW